MKNPQEVNISIVVPVYNSENCIDELAAQVSDALRGFCYELILVNDKSRDGSWLKILSLTEKSENILGVSLKKNSGQDSAILAGLNQSNGKFIVIMDDDLQQSPSDIPKLYEECKKGFDVCYGTFKQNHSWWKNLGSNLNGYLAELFLKKPSDLYLSPFKIIKADLVKDILKYQGPFPYVDGIILSLTSSIGQVEIVHHERFRGKGNYDLFKSISVFLKHITGYSLYPLRLVTICGIVASSLSVALGLFFIYDYLANQSHVEGWITLVLLIVFFNGLILMCLGLIGEYVGRIYLTVSTKRPYIIDQIISKKDGKRIDNG
ncbi:glycosyl transferase [Cytophagales bacterium WSM2-2]|nr:glycosyl transferase [Cytophagales bacterium WSM2-2]